MTGDLFSYDLLKIRKTRALRTFHQADYLAKDMESTLVKRLTSLKDLQKILIIGCPGGVLKQRLGAFECDFFDPLISEGFTENSLPFKAAHYDLIIDSFVFHWLNKPLDYLMAVHKVLRPGGLYLSGFLGGATLTELRQVCLKTDIELYEGACGRISPMIKPEAATKLLQTAGFKDSIVDHEEIGVSYGTVQNLIQDLRLMGESNALMDQRSLKVSKKYIECAGRNYQILFPQKDKNIIATFDFVFMTGWRSF